MAPFSLPAKGTSVKPVYLGGLTGWLFAGSIQESYSTATVESTAGNHHGIGGLVGSARRSLERCIRR